MLSKSTRYLSIKGEAVGVCVWRKFGGGGERESWRQEEEEEEEGFSEEVGEH